MGKKHNILAVEKVFQYTPESLQLVLDDNIIFDRDDFISFSDSLDDSSKYLNFDEVYRKLVSKEERDIIDNAEELK